AARAGTIGTPPAWLSQSTRIAGPAAGAAAARPPERFRSSRTPAAGARYRPCVCPAALSLRCHDREVDAVGRSFLERMVAKIQPRDLRLPGGTDGSGQRVLVTALGIVYRQEVGAVAACTDDPCGVLKLRVELLRVARLSQVEPLSTDVHRDRD